MAIDFTVKSLSFKASFDSKLCESLNYMPLFYVYVDNNSQLYQMLIKKIVS